MRKIVLKQLLNREVQKPRLKFNSGLALIGLRRTGPRELLLLPDQLLSPLWVSFFNVPVIFHNCVLEPIYTSKYREALSCIRPKYTFTRPRLEPKPLYPVSSAVNRRSRPSLKCALRTRPLACLSHMKRKIRKIFHTQLDKYFILLLEHGTQGLLGYIVVVFFLLYFFFSFVVGIIFLCFFPLKENEEISKQNLFSK